MSDCERCGKNTMRMFPSCERFLPQSNTDQGIRSKILACPEFETSTVFDYTPRGQDGGAL